MTKKPRSNPKHFGKTPKPINNPESFYSRYPSWRFSKIDKEHDKWSFQKKNVFSNEKILARLSDFEKQLWSEIIGDRNHFINIGDLVKEAQDRIVQLGYYYDTVFSLTLDGKGRLFGILEDGAMFFLWYDEKHEICPSMKKHT